MRDLEYIEALARQDLIQREPMSKDKGPRELSEVAKKRVEDKAIEDKAPSTGYPNLDVLIKGFIPGRLYTMTGETNVGKTAMACNFAYRTAEQKRKVLYFALEPDRTLIDYLASIHLRIKFDDIGSDDLTEYKSNYFDIYGADQIQTIESLISAVDGLDRYDLIIVDHIGYFVKSNASNFYAEQGNVLKQLALLAQRKSSAVMIIAHLNKSTNISPESWIPSMNQISGSAAFKQDSDDVLVIARKPEEMLESDLWMFGEEGCIYVNKTKAGRSGVVPVVFKDGTAMVVEKDKTIGHMSEKEVVNEITRGLAF